MGRQPGLTSTRADARETAASLGAPSAGPWAPGNESALPAVELRVAHDLEDGIVTVWSGRRRLLRAPLRRGGPPDWTLRLPAGDHMLRVEVSSSDGRIQLEGETPGAVRDGRARRLHVRVKERPGPRMELMWTGS
jgi:hypothetical protein